MGKKADLAAEEEARRVAQAVQAKHAKQKALLQVQRDAALKKATAQAAILKAAAPGTHSDDGREYAEIRSEIFTTEGSQVAKAGDRLSPKFIEQALEGRSASDTLTTEMSRTRLFKDIQEILAKPAHTAVFSKVKRQYDVFGVLREVAVNRLVLAEMSNLFRKAPWAYEQAIVSASLTSLCLKHVAPDDPRAAQIWIALACRDVGLPRIRPTILENKTKLKAADFNEYLQHEVISAALLARALGTSLAFRIALQHHRASAPNRWYPAVDGFSEEEIQHILQLLGVADAFAGMIAPRSFRPTPYSVRGALDQLIGGARLGWYDVNAVALLTAYCRKEFNLENIKVSIRREGDVPDENHFGIG